VADDPRRAHYLFDRQRCSQVLRHHPDHVHLAHTTAPGSRHAKRYEEVLELVWRASTLHRFLGAVPDAAVQVVPLGEA